MLGYLFNSKFGGYLYNFFHHQLLGIFLLLVGSIFLIKPLLFWGIIFLAHSNMDRIFGYGLKYTNSFKNTHLGPIHNSNKKQQK